MAILPCHERFGPHHHQRRRDDETRVWAATSDNVPGLATEADDMEVLVEKLKKMIPELLDANSVAHGEDVPFEILSQRFAVARREAA